MDEKNSYIPGQNAQYQQNQPYGQNVQYQQNQPYGQNAQYQQPYVQPARAVVYDTMPMKNNNMAIAGLVIGIFALVGFWIPLIDLVLSIGGIVCSGIGISKQGNASGMSVAGLIISIIALILSIILIILFAALFYL